MWEKNENKQKEAGFGPFKKTHNGPRSGSDLGVTGILDDWGHEAEAERRRVYHEKVVLRFNLGHNLWLTSSLPVTNDFRASAKSGLVRVLKWQN